MERRVIDELETISKSLFFTATQIRELANGRRGAAWRVINGVATTVETAGLTMAALVRPVAASSDRPGFTDDELRGPVGR